MKKREQKKREKKKQQEHLRLQAKERLENVLRVGGLLEGFRALPAWAREELIRKLLDGPEIVIEASSRDRPDMKSLKKDIERALQEERFQVEEGRVFPLTDFVAASAVLPQALACLASAHLSQKQRAFLEQAADRAQAVNEEWLPQFDVWISAAILARLLKASRMDQGVVGCLLTVPNSTPGQPVFRVTLLRNEPRPVRAEIDGLQRPAYQCGLPLWTDGIVWIEADGELFGLDAGRKHPVCIQSHALRKLKERFPADGTVEEVVQYGMLESLTDLCVVERQGDSYWIAYHVGGRRLGYLVARVAQGKIVITTFLFLTMEGTPEFRKLREKLGLCRRDIQHEGLDRLETFLSPAILQDQDLVRLLEECGCGSLLALARDGFPYYPVRDRAGDLRKFLRLPEKRRYLKWIDRRQIEECHNGHRRGDPAIR
jgi:hypothetical protein